MAQKVWSDGKAHDSMAGTGSKKVGGASDGGFKPLASTPSVGDFKPPVSKPRGDLSQRTVSNKQGSGKGYGA